MKVSYEDDLANHFGLQRRGGGNLVKHFGIELTQHHRALPDALASAHLLMKITVA